MAAEFDLIRRYFSRPPQRRDSVVVGVGDDAAVLRPEAGSELLLSTDMLSEGVHFFAAAAPRDLGWKVLAVSLSDMAAMGAQPLWALLAAALPSADEQWLQAFAAGMFECADSFGVDLIGGDTTCGRRNFCLTICGEAPAGEALLRSGAGAGDEIWISGRPGRAALALAHLQGAAPAAALAAAARADCLAALHRPQPRCALGLALRGVASAAIDVSDGLLADLAHLLTASGLAAALRIDFPPPPAGIDAAFWRQCYLAGGDDYELLFTAAPAQHKQVLTAAANADSPVACIGVMEHGVSAAISLCDASGKAVDCPRQGYQHFA